MATLWQGLFWGLFLLACPECQAKVQVSVPEVMEVMLGDEVSIFCTHTMTGEDSFLLVEWFITDRNGEQRRVAYSDQGKQGVDRGTEYTGRISMDPSHSLIIHAVDVTDERVFSCQVTAGTGSGTGETQLKVYEFPEPPELTHNSGILSVTEAFASQIATCFSRNAIPVPTITWYKDGHLLNASTDHNKELYVVSRTVKEASGLYSVSNSLYLRPNKADKDSNFSCKVNYSMPHGKVGSAMSEAFKVSLHYYTENVEFGLESPEVIKEGDNVQLHCTGDGYPSSEYVFSKVQAKDMMKDLGSNSEGILILEGVTKDDSGTYQCQVLDFDSPPEIELEKEVTIFVNYLDPLVLHPSKTATAELGGNLELSCTGSGSKTPILSWSKQDKEHVGDGGQLQLQSLTYHMAGTYRCEATIPSIPGLRREQSVQVIVEGRPQVEQHQSVTHYDRLGQTATLTCSALGYPEPEIIWSAPGQEVARPIANGIRSELSVEVTTELIQSGVKCEVHNKHGTAEQLFQFQTVDGEENQGGSMVAVIAVCVCVLILLLIVAFFYFMQRRGQLPCGGGEKRSLTPKEGNPDDTVVEMKTDKRNEQTGLLSHGGGSGGSGGGGGTNEC